MNLDEVSALKLVFDLNRNLVFPPPVIIPIHIYEELRPKTKVTMRGLVRYFVSREANQIQITSGLVISRVTDILLTDANIHEKLNYCNLSSRINAIIRRRGPRR
ncbi:8926_t:CDS:1 [Funneliformis geosporum]|uniref:5026_t:CDS:1 n=1 Tax=Funneliformis geosporum TaxID=1117311 RepID=A0A9W4SQI6_9GLOM|nr:8926_t:CDS:1 [Funneliformis geosporum]CAI2179043.1 5026_t:CDS:1 [Funneliformis geosporum]